MYTETYRFANHVLEICSLYPYVHTVCTAYRTNEEPEYRIEISEEDIRGEIRRNMENGESSLPNDYYESLAVYRKIADWMIGHDTLLFHGSALAVDGDGFLFTAKSGTGKSTHARLWREMLGDRVVMINDDKPLLIVREKQIFVCGTPWNGKHHLDTNRIVPLRGIAVVHRDPCNHIHPAGSEDIWSILLQQAYRPEDPEKMKKVLLLLDRIRKYTEMWDLYCNMELEAAQIAYAAMSRQKGSKI